LTDVSQVLTASIIRVLVRVRTSETSTDFDPLIEAASIFETSVTFYENTQLNIPEDFVLATMRT
jgi:hypothetical protein